MARFFRPARMGWQLTTALVATAFGFSSTASAQGWIEPSPDARGQAVVRLETDVQVRVVAQVAYVEVTEWFENRSRGVAEGSYLYPLPGEAVFSGFSLWQGEQELRGEVLDAREAREIYEGIVRKRMDPALIELAGQGLLRARVFPIEPGQKRKVMLRYTQLLARSGDALQFRYAAGTGGASNIFPTPIEPLPPTPRCAPWQACPTRRPNDDADLPEHEHGELRLELIAEQGDRFLEPFSPTHSLEHERRGDRLVVRTEGELRGRLSVFLPLAREGLGLSLVTHRTPGEDGYFMLTLTPGTQETEYEPRDMTLVLDVSGSMSGDKMQQARTAALHLLETLSPQDRFRLVAFSSGVRPESEDWRRAGSQELAAARAWVERLQAEGSTNIEGALVEGLRLQSPAGRLPVVIFMTDGLPTVGERNAERIAERAEAAGRRARVFAFGVGHDVDTHLLDALSAATRGTTTYVDPGESVARAMELLAAKVRHPVLTDLALRSESDLEEVYPVVLPDLFAGESMVLFGRYSRASQRGEVRVTGLQGGQRLSFATDAAFPTSEDGNDYIPRLWASRKIGHLSRQIRLEGASEALIDEIRATALRYGLPSDYTSYLVVEPGMVAQAGALQFRGDAPPPAAPVVGNAAGSARRLEASGAGAVRAAEEQARMREVRSSADLAQVERDAAALPATSNGGTRQVGGRVFQTQNGVWMEVQSAPATRAQRVVAIKLYSKAYFDVLRALPELVPMAQALVRLETRGQAVTVRLDEAGKETLTADELRALTRDFRGPAPVSAPARPGEGID